ncbi:MAG TPA: universal stress protein [Gaiellaceae bacterium]
MGNGEPPSTETTAAAVVQELFARTVCGVDSSEASIEAVRQAVRLGPAGNELLLVAVSESHLAVHAGMQAPKVTAEIEADARQALDAASEVAVGAQTRLVQGRAAETLLRVVTEESSTLVCIGSHDHRRTPGIFLGSVTTLMLHSAPCSVLVARPPAGEFPRAILAGVDGSAESLRAAAVAGALGQRLDVRPTFLVATGGRSNEIDAAALAGSGLDLDYSDAHPVAALVEMAQDADLVVLGSRGLRGLRALGSVSERVAHRADCSLLVVRGPG